MSNRRWAVFREDGTPQAFYDDIVWTAETRPSEAVEISQEDWLDFINNQGQRRWNGISPEPFEPPPAPLIDPPAWPRSWFAGLSSSEFLEAIGQIVVFGGLIDGAVSRVFWLYTGLAWEIGTVVTGELKTPAMIEMLRKIVPLTDYSLERKADFEAVARELREIALIRNEYVHWEWGVGAGATAILSRFITAKRSDLRSTKQIGLDEIRATAERFAAVLMKLNHHALPDDGDHLPHPLRPAWRSP